jgi:hypothetical protein
VIIQHPQKNAPESFDRVSNFGIVAVHFSPIWALQSRHNLVHADAALPGTRVRGYDISETHVYLDTEP